MPIYEYRCRQCSKVFEFLVRTASSEGEGEQRCPECGSGDLSRLFSLFASRSGAGDKVSNGGGGCCGGGCGCH